MNSSEPKAFYVYNNSTKNFEKMYFSRQTVPGRQARPQQTVHNQQEEIIQTMEFVPFEIPMW